MPLLANSSAALDESEVTLQALAVLNLEKL